MIKFVRRDGKLVNANAAVVERASSDEPWVKNIRLRFAKIGHIDPGGRFIRCSAMSTLGCYYATELQLPAPGHERNTMCLKELHVGRMYHLKPFGFQRDGQIFLAHQINSLAG